MIKELMHDPVILKKTANTTLRKAVSHFSAARVSVRDIRR